jgi:RNA-directed DNA polymerase
MQGLAFANRTATPTDWQRINWRAANRRVRNLRQRIFRATQAGDWDKVQSLQRLMLRSYANTLVSVRRVTQVNQGKRTAGVDKLVVKTPERRGQVVDHLMTFQPWTAQPAKRVYIPKANGKLRPLGIPTIIDRCLQARVKNALEPSWEARFEATSYGFRPGRGCHDAIAKIYTLAHAKGRKAWVVDADIKGAFDNIAHSYILDAIGSFPARELIKQWLKAGYVDKGVLHATDAGTGQGTVVSPLLANIALHGLEKALGVTRNTQGAITSPRALVRYADDFVVFCESRDDALAVVDLLKDWLAERGLTLSGEKTRLVHLTEGFDFLGFTVKRYKIPRTRTGYKLLITPSTESVKRLRERLRAEWHALVGHPLDALITRLNPIIRGWANYFRIGVASRTFHALDHWMVTRELHYTKRRHPHKSHAWRTARYWGQLNPRSRNTWVFGNKQTGAYLHLFAWSKIDRHVLVRGTASPDDPRLREYWARRAAARAKDLRPSLQKIATRQGSVCRVCGESLFNEEELHKHHIQPKARGGPDSYTNLELTHLYCHQQIHGGDTEVIRTAVPEPTRAWLRSWLA